MTDNTPNQPAAIATQMHRLVCELFPICRSITGPGLRETLERIGELIPLQVTEVPSGTRVFDWEIPPEWRIRDAHIRDPQGEKLVDFAESNLHVVNYSHAVNTKLSLPELAKRLHTLPGQPDVIPYRTTYYQRDWGFCVPHVALSAFSVGEYEVLIDADLDPRGSLTYGEFILPGHVPDEIYFSCHVCHPSLANDNLAAVAIAIELAKFLASEPRHYSYRILFAPGTIGTIAWLARNAWARGRIIGGLVLALLGDSQKLTYKRTRNGSTLIDHATEFTLKSMGLDHRVINFSPFGYDERQHGTPGINLPIGRLSRSTEGEYPQYHTSADTPKIVSEESLQHSLLTLQNIVQSVESDRTFVNRKPHGEPQLGRRGLYPVHSGETDPLELQQAVMWNLSLSNGETSLTEISNRSGLSLGTLKSAATVLQDNALLTPSKSQRDRDNARASTHGQPSSAALEQSRQAHECIPGGAHTYAKGDDQFPINAPRFFDRGEGCFVYDSDGNRYIEYGMGLRAVGLGHAFPRVVEAAYARMKQGSNFTRPSTIELKTAEALLQLLPAADMVKFAKNGSDATTAAIRLARACTGRQRILLCKDQPFFSVDDWFIGTTPMNAGIPEEAYSPIVRFPYNDIGALERLLDENPRKFACLVMEAATYVEPQPGYLQKVQALCQKHGTLFVLDEMITGFRWNVGGAQADYGLAPDLSTFGKALGNGFSVAALTGKQEFMSRGGLDHEEDRVFLLSYTHGAETHSLAAAQETIRTYLEEPVIETLYLRGHQLKEGLTDVARELGVDKHFYVLGRGCNLIYVTEDADGQRSQGFRTLLLQELIKLQIFAPSLVVSYSHGEHEVAQTINAFRQALKVYSQALESGYERFLDGRPSKPVFRSKN